MWKGVVAHSVPLCLLLFPSALHLAGVAEWEGKQLFPTSSLPALKVLMLVCFVLFCFFSDAGVIILGFLINRDVSMKTKQIVS